MWDRGYHGYQHPVSFDGKDRRFCTSNIYKVSFLWSGSFWQIRNLIKSRLFTQDFRIIFLNLVDYETGVITVTSILCHLMETIFFLWLVHLVKSWFNEMPCSSKGAWFKTLDYYPPEFWNYIFKFGWLCETGVITVTNILCHLMEKTLAIASLNDEASMVCMDSSSSCILMFADGASSKSRSTFEVLPLCMSLYMWIIPEVEKF